MKLDFSKMWAYRFTWIGGLENTLLITAVSLAVSVAISLIIAFFKMSKIKPLNWFATVYISIFRGTPAIVQIMFIYFGIPQLIGHKLTPFVAGFIALGLNSAAFMSELIRGGIQSVDYGQTEAAMAMGMSKIRIQFGIVIPQAIKSILPGLINEVIGVLKGSSLVYAIGFAELMRQTNMVISSTFRSFEAYIIVAVIYYILVMILTAIGGRVERWVSKSGKRS